MSSRDKAVLVGTASSALDFYQDATSRFFGDDSLLAIDIWAFLAHMPSVAPKLGPIIQNARRGLQQSELRFGECDSRTVRYQLRLARLEWEETRYLNLKPTVPQSRYEKILEQATQRVDCNPAFKYIAECNLAWMHNENGSHEAAEGYMQAALSTALSEGSHDDIMNHCITLERWLVDRGEHDKAREVRQAWERLTPPEEG